MPATSGRHTISSSILWVCNSAASKNAAASRRRRNDGNPILRRAARWLILKGQQHEHQQDGRRRLLALYGEGIDIDAATQRDLVERSEGISGAFIKAGPFRCPPRRRTDPADSGVRALHAPRLQHIDAHLRPVMLGP